MFYVVSSSPHVDFITVFPLVNSIVTLNSEIYRKNCFFITLNALFYAKMRFFEKKHYFLLKTTQFFKKHIDNASILGYIISVKGSFLPL